VGDKRFAHCNRFSDCLAGNVVFSDVVRSWF
jgi:hypothetical protein